MTADLVLALALAALNHAAELSALYAKAKAEGRDLTPEEIAIVRAGSVAANDRLQAAIDAAAPAAA
jgi:hypothetical protein